MKKNVKVLLLICVTVLILVLVGYFYFQGMKTMDHSTTSKKTTTKVSTLRQAEFTLTAQQSNLEVLPDKFLPVWTYNNSVPGPEIRVKQGDTVKITLKNELPEPVSIHWHGVPVPNDMDGIPGVTQDSVKPGDSFTYQFKTDVSGTYWYHSHQDSAAQVDKGLYGAFIVEAVDGKVDRDYTLVLDEWISTAATPMNKNKTENKPMDHSKMSMRGQSNTQSKMGMGKDMGDDMSMYDLYTINGKSGSLVEKLLVKQGEKVRIRLINAGYKSHQIHLHGHEFAITTTDGQPINKPKKLKDKLISIAPGERYDIEFEANQSGQWNLEDHGDGVFVKGMKALIQYEGSNEINDQPNETVKLAKVDMTQYGDKSQAPFTLDQKFTLEYSMNLNTEKNNGETVFTINGKTFPNTDNLQVNKGDTIKVRFVNNSKIEDHPMHLHGHFFQVLSKNGKPIEGASLMKDTLNVKPGEEYVVAFMADNPGNWMFHCHDLHHASAGMTTELKYTDFKSNYVVDPKADNKH